jgi:hypothetical protein
MRLYFAVIAALLIAGAAWLFVRRVAVAAKGVSVLGRVISHETREDDGTLHYLPVVTFIDHRGTERRFTSVAGGSQPSPPVGAAVTVRFHPEDPGMAYVVSFLHMWAAPLAMFVLGAAAVVAALQA